MKELTNEEKELLLKDLCARLPYGVIVDYKESEYDFHRWKISTLDAPAYSRSGSLINTDTDGWIDYNEYHGCGMSSGSRPLHLGITLPFLRPMSSMTEEESAELSNIISEWFDKELFDLTEEPFLEYALSKINYSISPLLFDWLNVHHFDYRGLIPKGLALPAPEGMYKF